MPQKRANATLCRLIPLRRHPERQRRIGVGGPLDQRATRSHRSLATLGMTSLGLAMQRVLAVVTAELLELELLRHGLLVLGRRVVPTLALAALQRDDFSSLARHCFRTPRSFSGALDEI